MQTFIVSTDHEETGWILDRKRLNKQILEAYQILNVIRGNEFNSNGRITAWAHHPAVMMWVGYHDALAEYAWQLVSVANRRDINVSTYREILPPRTRSAPMPWWWESDVDKVIASHQASLYRKDDDHYFQYAWSQVNKPELCCSRCNYWWPTHAIGAKTWDDIALSGVDVV